MSIDFACGSVRMYHFPMGRKIIPICRLKPGDRIKSRDEPARDWNTVVKIIQCGIWTIVLIDPPFPTARMVFAFFPDQQVYAKHGLPLSKSVKEKCRPTLLAWESFAINPNDICVVFSIVGAHSVPPFLKEPQNTAAREPASPRETVRILILSTKEIDFELRDRITALANRVAYVPFGFSLMGLPPSDLRLIVSEGKLIVKSGKSVR